MNPCQRCKRKVLIVDDLADDRLVVRIILEKEGFMVLEAKNNKEALLIINKEKLDLVLLDIKMPEMDGLELLEKIRKENDANSLPVIIYSSIPNCGDDYRSKGSNGYIKKYCDSKYFISKIKETLTK